MKTFNELQDHIKNNSISFNLLYSFGAYDVAISNGIKYAIENKILKDQELNTAIKYFYIGKNGDGVTPLNGTEYGQYKTSINTPNNDAIICIKREKHPAGKNKNYFICYFSIER